MSEFNSNMPVQPTSVPTSAGAVPPAVAIPTPPITETRPQRAPGSPFNTPSMIAQQGQPPIPQQRPTVDFDQLWQMVNQNTIAIQNMNAQLQGPYGERIYKSTFVAKLGTSSSDGTLWKFQEYTNVGGALVSFTDGRKCTSTADPSAAIGMNPGNFGAGDFVVMVEIEDGGNFRYQFGISVGNSISLLVTSDFAAGSQWGRYKAKSYASGATATATTTTLGTLSSSENVIFINGSEWGKATQNNLLLSTNTSVFAQGPVSATVIGSCVISGVTYIMATASVEFAGCTVSTDGGSP